MRSYDEYCAVARSLDVVGDRWTLLIVRELTLKGPSRYTDLRAGLPGIATNLLAERLRELERAGVIAREEAPPPIATTLFSLTPRGERLRPLLEELGRWGMPLMLEQRPADAVRSHWLAWALELLLADHQPDEPAITIELRTGDQPITLETSDGRVQIAVERSDAPDAVVTGEANPVLGLVFGLLDLDAAAAAGVTYEGSAEVLERIRPTTAELAALM
jgi:DNA-binding HxlR family transcriptional regulator